MRQISSLSPAICAFFICANFGNITSEQEAKSKPSLCFYGTITTLNNEKQAIKNILVGGLFERIPLFGATEKHDPTIDPTGDTTFVALDDILSIKPTFENKNEGIRSYKNRDYRIVTVTFKSSEKGQSILANEPSEKRFLIEMSRKISCEQITSSGDLARELSFESIKELSIIGFRPGERKSKQMEDQKEPSAAKEALCAEAKKDLQQIDIESKGIFSTMIQKVKKSINYICG